MKITNNTADEKEAAGMLDEYQNIPQYANGEIHDQLCKFYPTPFHLGSHNLLDPQPALIKQMQHSVTPQLECSSTNHLHHMGHHAGHG